MEDYLATIEVTFLGAGGSDTMELTCPANYDYTPERQEIAYTEYTDDGEHLTRIVLEDGRVDILRGGIMDLHLSENVRVSDAYELDFGTIMVEYQAESIESRLTESGGVVEMRYMMDLGGEVTQNCVKVTLTERRG